MSRYDDMPRQDYNAELRRLAEGYSGVVDRHADEIEVVIIEKPRV